MKSKAACVSIFIVLSLFVNANTVKLQRYERIDPYPDIKTVKWGGKEYVYMDSADTYLDSAQPSANFGASRTLRLLPNQNNSILLQFGQLNRAVWRGAKITDVKLILHPVEGRYARDTALGIYRITREWRDGGADGKPMVWTATYKSAMSSAGKNAVNWALPGANGNGDRSMTPSLIQNTSAGYDPKTNTWTLTGDGLLKDVQYWFGRHYRNYGWLLRMENPKKAKGCVEFYSSDDMNKALRPELIITYEPLLNEGKMEGVDLNVTFIERTPRYLRWNDNGSTAYERKQFRRDNAGIMKYPDNAETKKQPSKGEMMTYTAHVKNSGFSEYKGSIKCTWSFNGKILKEFVRNCRLAPEEELTEQIKLPWSGELSDHRDEKLMFEVEPESNIPEITKNNNAQSKYIKARTWKYWVEKKPYEYGKQFMTAYGSYSYEDYLKWHEHIWNETYLDKSRFDGYAPDGSTMRATLDDFEIVADGRLGGGIHRLDDKPDFHFDGEWGTEWLKGSALNDKAAVENIENFIRGQRIILEGSLLHEASHQVLGAFDIYWSNIEPSEPTNPNGKAKLKDGGEHYITRGSMYAYSCLMGGDDTRPNELYTEGTGLYALHTVMGYNANTPFRGGFYGEWQYDLPRKIFVRLLASDGSPLKNAKVKIWQFTGMQILDEDVVAESLTANEEGILKLPDQDSLEEADYTTLTGHTLLKKNPFGRVDVVGSNTVLLLKIEALGQKDYRFIRLVELNRGYWMGYKDEYIHDVSTMMASAEVDWTTNLAENKPVRTVLNPQESAKLVDGDATSAWSGGAAPLGAYIQIDLGSPTAIGAVRLYQHGWLGQFFQRFKMEVSNDPEFRLGVIEVARQFPYSFSLTMVNDKDVDPDNNQLRWITYGVKPTLGRYLRITCMENSYANLSEIRIYPAKLPQLAQVLALDIGKE